MTSAPVGHPGSPFWVPSAALQAHLNLTATGRPDCDWLSHVRSAHLPARVGRTLVLGCGNGFLERAFARHAGIGEILATDPDEAAVESARSQTRREGLASITYARCDPDRDPLPGNGWDLILANDLLHHVANTERLFRAVREALGPRGLFVFSEYTGPARFQHDDATMAMVDRYFRVLPDRIRIEPGTGKLLWRRERVDAGRLARENPHEAAASDALLPLARRLFLAEAELSGGGGLLHPLLSGLARNFQAGSRDDERLLELLCAAEANAVSERTVAPLFTVFVGRRFD